MYMSSKKRNFIILISIAFGFGLAFWFRQAYQPSLPEIPEAIIIGTAADYPPFSFKEKDSAGNEQIVGFDIDIAVEAMKRLKKTITLKDVPFELLIPQAQMGAVHSIAAGLSITPERQQKVFFTQPYLTETPLVVVSLKDKAFKSLDDLVDKRVVVNAGYTTDTYASKLNQIAVERVPSQADAMNALKRGVADAYITEGNTLQALFDTYGNDMFNTFIISETNERSALAVSKLYPKLSQQLNNIIGEMLVDGTIEQFKQKWRVQ
jgi:arginine/lysine/histidine transporter system substrate-binding protein